MPQQKSDIVTVNHKKGLSEYSSTVVKIPIFVEISIKMRKKKSLLIISPPRKSCPLGPPASVSDRICESRGAALSSSPGIWPMDPHGLPGGKNGMEGTYGGGHAWHRDLGHSK